MVETEGRKERIDGPNLDPPSATLVPEGRRVDMVAAVRDEEGKGVEAVQDSLPGSGPGKPLQNLLKNQSRGDHHLAGFQSLSEGSYLG
jgi:hypothetical protein